MKEKLAAIRYFYYGIQMIIMAALPFVCCIWLGGFLRERFSLGGWVTPVAVITALLWSAADLYTFGRMLLREINSDSGERHKK